MHDFNVLERRAKDLIASGHPADALKIYLYMAEGDLSTLDIWGCECECYERMGDLHAAKDRYGRAVEENPGVPNRVEARRRLEGVNIDHLISRAAAPRLVVAGETRFRSRPGCARRSAPAFCTPKGASQFVFPNGMVCGSIWSRGQDGRRQGPHLNLEVPGCGNIHIPLRE